MYHSTTPSPYRIPWGALLTSLVASWVLIYLAFALAPPEPSQRLVGYGCDGSNGEPLYRNEEDEFPRCDSVEAAR